MNIRLNRRRGIIIVAGIASLILYCGLYLHFRINHTFIHRAGRYAPEVSRGHPRRSTNHFIEPGQVADGPQVFASVMFAAATASETDDLGDVDIESMLASAAKQIQKMEKDRDRLFLLFKPAAIIEVLVWKVVNPDPLRKI